MYDPSNLQAACRSCNFARHGAGYFRERHDAMLDAARPPSPGAILRTPPRSGRPQVTASAYVPWAMALHGVDAEPTDHRHGRWEVTPWIDLGGAHFAICPDSCTSPVRWPRPPRGPDPGPVVQLEGARI